MGVFRPSKYGLAPRVPEEQDLAGRGRSLALLGENLQERKEGPTQRTLAVETDSSSSKHAGLGPETPPDSEPHFVSITWCVN